MPDMSSEGVLLLEDEVKKEYEAPPHHQEVPDGASQESKPLLPHLSSYSCCDIPVLFSSSSSSSRRKEQPYTVSKILLSAISPWLAGLIEGASLAHFVQTYHLAQLQVPF